MKNKKIKIGLTGGGSGGHLFPLIAVVDFLRQSQNKPDNFQQQLNNETNFDFIFYGPKGELEKEMMSRKKIKHRSIPSGKLRRYFSFRYLVDPCKFVLGVISSLFYLLIDMPDVLFAKGGYASVPVVIAAWLYRIPILIHESDAKPGLANQFMATLARRIAVSFDRARLYLPNSKVIVTGTPVDQRVLNGDPEKGRELLGMKDKSRPVVLVLGGSQGAMFLNKKILKMLKALLEKFQIIHQTGKKHYQTIIDVADKMGYPPNENGYYPLPFIGEEIKHYFALADVVISRAGSTAIAEIAANAKPAILVPISQSANDHQRLNAYEVARQGGAIVLEENNFKQHLVILRLRQLTEQEDLRQKIIQNIKKFYNPRATEMIVTELLNLVH